MRHFFQDLIDTEMQVEDLIQLACLLAIRPPKINQNTQLGISNHLHEYWSASRDRLDRWNFYLAPAFKLASAEERRKRCNAAPETNLDARAPAHSTSRLAVITEMILSDPLSRIWAAILADPRKCSIDTSPGNATGRFKNPTCDIIEHHSKLMRHTLKNLERHLAKKTHRNLVRTLFRRTRRWTDLLLAHVEQSRPASCFAPNPQRCLDFAEDLRSQWTRGNGPQLAVLTITSARQAICALATECTFSACLNYRIGASILQSCDSDDLESIGLMNPCGVTRLWATFASCETMVGAALEGRSMPIASPIG